RKAGLPEMEYRELPCLGALDPLMAMRELNAGADLVLGVGCYISRCEHISGSQRARRALGRVGDVLEEVGIDRSRVGLVLGSPIDPRGIHEAIKEFISSEGGDEE
ncbi:MAG: hydrogenase iron-sulfur subunit, partial [Thermoplasmata archaeon]|nr:hydrogenase iron-sulfur subunit [Thermoplasmata archaeon]NIS10938.1 hydrogenase iron-sulfur subunit [Thermoplasmata archaeon]NIS21601.1 hydrogenase iron-sulfur subunit [Thermoplasmata archaeon]NIT75897.1 hydrogenase iron-sulfur subunit [Thermoplasmata archaeon]NIU48021.1 hydrogenase iron-sulfur subunit [Thermoplasmata archaeon]